MGNPKDIYAWYLWKRRVDVGDSNFLHITDLPELGFSSVYAIDETTATTLQASQDYRGFKGIVWSEKLWIDCDTEAASLSVENGLRELGFGFEKWTTGNRGAHFGVNRAVEPSQILPLRDKSWVKVRFPEADLRLYSHLHLFRRPGNPHEKTGRKKELVETVNGGTLSYGHQENRVQEGSINTSGVRVDSSIFEDQYIMWCSTPQENGKRHETLCKLAARLAARGEGSEFALRWLQHVNALFSEPKADEELVKVIKWAYSK
jgi:hypothetical protein